jgi:sugar lactone lactonase YvrE
MKIAPVGRKNMVDISCVLESKAKLGEGPLWDPREQVLWWLDIKSHEIHRFDPASGADTVWKTPEDIGCLAVRDRGGLVVAMKSGLFFFDPKTGRFDKILDPESDRPQNRFNDGKPDRQGRFWPGSMYEGDKPQPSAGLYRLDADLSCRRVVSDIVCSNGLAWSPDSKVMYYADSLAQRVWAWDFDPVMGEVANRRSYVDTSAFNSNPDGATVDAEGCYWLTLPEADKVARFDPAGKVMQVIDFPVFHPTCAMFGGPDLDVLYITTATMFRTPDVLATRPLTGGLFAMDVGVKGLPEAHFKG